MLILGCIMIVITVQDQSNRLLYTLYTSLNNILSTYFAEDPISIDDLEMGEFGEPLSDSDINYLKSLFRNYNGDEKEN